MTSTRHHLDFSGMGQFSQDTVGDGLLYTALPAQDQRPSLLFLPGAYHGAWCYAHYLAYFAERGWGSHALDYPGHGALAAHPDTAQTIAALGASAIKARQHIAGPVIVVGHSMGALPALLCATHTQVSAVVLLAPSPPANLPGAQGLPAVPAGVMRPAPAAAEIRQRFLALAPDYDVSSVIQRLNAESPQVLNDRYLLRQAIAPAGIAVPGLCLEAGLDTQDRHPPGQDRAVADFFGFEHQLLAQHPHCMMYAPDWQSSAQTLERWCNQQFL